MRNLPEFPGQTELKYEHQDVISERLREKGILSSDYAFYNLMGWYLTRPPKISRIQDHLLLNLEGPDGSCMLLPPLGSGPIKAVLSSLLGYLPELGCPRTLSYVPKCLRDEILEAFPRTRFEPRPGDFDYIHARKDLAELSGRRFHQKKNFVNRVIDEWNPTVREIDAETVRVAEAFLRNWYEETSAEDVTMKIEALAAMRMLPHLKRVGGIGILVEIEGVVSGLSVASPVHPNCFVVSLEKAVKSHKGLYQYVNWAMANRIPASVEFINRETDLGIEGLRNAKASYHPIKLEEKFTLYFD